MDPNVSPSWWLANYSIRKESFGHFFWAQNRKEAEMIANQLGFDLEPGFQPIRGPAEWRASKLIEHGFSTTSPEVHHAVIFSSFLAARAKVATADELLCDLSPLHQLAHRREFRTGNARLIRPKPKALLAKIQDLEAVIPGLPPHHVEMTLPPRRLRRA